MATSDNTRPTKTEAFKENLAPPSHGKGSDNNDRKKADTEPEKVEDLAVEREQYQERQEEEFQAEVKADRKKSPVDALGLPEGEGDEVWVGAIEVAARSTQAGENGEPIEESEKDYNERVKGAEAALVNGAQQFLSPLYGSLRPLAYSLTKTDTHVRLAIVNTETNPDPTRVGGKPNADGKY